jgi:hypothetical protein
VAAVPFGLPPCCTCRPTRTNGGALHRSRTEASIAHVNHMLTDPVDANDVVLAKMLADDTLRPTQMPAAPV